MDRGESLHGNLDPCIKSALPLPLIKECQYLAMTPIGPLIKTGNSNVASSWIIIELSPAGAAIARARRAGEAPDRAVIMTLVNVRASDGDLLRPRVIIEFLPAGTTVAATRRASITPDQTVAM